MSLRCSLTSRPRQEALDIIRGRGDLSGCADHIMKRRSARCGANGGQLRVRRVSGHRIHKTCVTRRRKLAKFFFFFFFFFFKRRHAMVMRAAGGACVRCWRASFRKPESKIQPIKDESGARAASSDTRPVRSRSVENIGVAEIQDFWSCVDGAASNLCC